MRTTGRRVALWTGVAVTLLLGASAFAFRTTFLEHWYIAGLYSEDMGRRLECADALGAMKSLRAVPYLVDRIREDEREFPIRISSKYWPSTHYLTPLIHTLHRIGPKALSAVKKSLFANEDKEWLKRIPEVLEAARLQRVIRIEYSVSKLAPNWKEVLAAIEAIELGA